MKKRILTLVLCIAMLFALAACGEKTTQTPDPTGTSDPGTSSDALPKIDDLELLSGSATGS